MKKRTLIKFRDSDHTYYNGNKKLISVNGLLAHFGFAYDRDYWLVHGALKDNIPDFYRRFFSKFNFEDKKPNIRQLKDHFSNEISKLDCLGEEVAKVADRWELSNVNGTKFHLECETAAYNAGELKNPFTGKMYKVVPKPEIPVGFDNATLTDRLEDLPDGCHLELIVHSLEHDLTGQADEVFIQTIDGIRYVDVGDHKTNAKKPKEMGNEMCFAPISHLVDCTLTKYKLQVSLYAHLLERAGFVVRHVGIYHYENYDYATKNVMRFKYHGKECKNILAMWQDEGMVK